MASSQKRKAHGKALGNRELSWLQFNRRVQMEADNPANPLLERAKFLAIATSNLDEFVQVRYGNLYANALGPKAHKKTQGGLPLDKLLKRVNKEMLRQQNLQYLLFEGIRSELYLQKVQLYPTFTLTESMRAKETLIFKEEIKPNLKKLALEEEPQQKQLHLLVKLVQPRKKTLRFVMLALPTALPRLFDLSDSPEVHQLIRLEDIVRHHLASVFPRVKIEQAAVFRVIRNQDFPVEAATQAEVVPAVKEMLQLRRTGQVRRLEAEERMGEEMLSMLMLRFGLPPEQRYRVTGPLDLNKLMMNLYGLLPRADLKYSPVEPQPLRELMGEGLWKRIAAKDTLLYHPYHSFAPVVHFVQQAAKDPAVRSIKQTLYRVSSNSPIVQALAEAAENGKEVVVLFEACARFDEESNLFWGERLEKAGCRVLYGLPGLKTHSKITLVERMERGKTKRYLHLGTGNYHDGTAKLYTDFGLLTADQALGQDAQNFFAELSGVTDLPMGELIRAPEKLKTTLLHLIEREKENALLGKPAGILAKMNSLSDEGMIAALCSASSAGVPIRLLVRGLCCLLPGVPGVSENIQVRSIVGRHLEHARAFCFVAGGEDQVYLSSADWMPRNLHKRVELMFPVKDESCKRAVENVLRLQWQDTEKAWEQGPDGAYERHSPKGQPKLNAQDALLYRLHEVLAGEAPPPSMDGKGAAESPAGKAEHHG